jgi:hypothetical protein
LKKEKTNVTRTHKEQRGDGKQVTEEKPKGKEKTEKYGEGRKGKDWYK